MSGIQLERRCERSRFRTIAVVIAASLSAITASACLAADGPGPDPATQQKGLTYDLFVGQPIVKPAGFVSASTTAGFNLNWSF